MLCLVCSRYFIEFWAVTSLLADLFRLYRAKEIFGCKQPKAKLLISVSATHYSNFFDFFPKNSLNFLELYAISVKFNTFTSERIHTYKLYLTTLASSAKFPGFHKGREKQNIFRPTSKKNRKRV